MNTPTFKEDGGVTSGVADLRKFHCRVFRDRLNLYGEGIE
jgi:hypothetical protein